jgi:hypothetical protein
MGDFLYLYGMKVFHYVYHLIDPVTGQFYYGSRTCKGITPQEDVKYKGSMKAWKPEDKNRLVKTILREFPTREEATLYEIELIKLYVKDDLNENYHIPTIGFSMLGLPSRYKKEQDLYVEQVTKVHNSFFTYPNLIYVDNKTNIIVTCPNHGDFPTSPKHHLNGGGCPDCYFDRNTGDGHSRTINVINVFTKEISNINQTAIKLKMNSGALSDRLNNKPNRPNGTGYLLLDEYNKMSKEQISNYIGYVKNFLPRRKGQSFKSNTEWCDKISKATKSGNNPRARKVINSETNVVYGCIKDAAESYGIDRKRLNDFLNGKVKTKTYPFKLV